MDLENLLNASSKKGKKRVAASETSSGANPEPMKRSRKTIANEKCASQQIIIEPADDQFHSQTPAVVDTKEQAMGSTHQVKFSDKAPKMVFLEPSWPLPQEAGFTSSQIYSQYATSSWCHFKSFQSCDWDLINNDNFEELFERSLNFILSWTDAQKENTRLTKDVKELKRNHKAELESAQKEAKDRSEARKTFRKS
uniref:Uncharacterized protein n=1 Tax=Cannabis sativa TaxID=3483 RepID=A0A803PU26_CANSA